MPYDVFVRLPNGRILRLRKAMYGLRVAPRLWREHLAATLRRLGLQESAEEPCLFYNQYIIVIFYVDDIARFYHPKHRAQFDQFNQALHAAYDLRDIGEL